MNMRGQYPFFAILWIAASALLACTDLQGLEDQLEQSGGNGGAGADASMPSAGAAGVAAVTGGMGGVAGAIGGASGAMSGASGAMAGGGGMSSSCAPGTEGCSCAAGACEDGLICGEAMCRRASCGDGKTDPGEQCDDGNTFNNDACTAACQTAYCGDGYTNRAAEECDDENTVDEDACSNACVERDYNVVFITSTTHRVGTLGGLAGADAVCASRATAAGLDGTFVAWMNSTTTSIADRLAGARGFVRPDGRPFIDTIDSEAVFYLPNLNEMGIVVSADGTAIIGGSPNDVGVAVCDDWTSESADDSFVATEPHFGAGSWNEALGAAPCAGEFRLFCFQKDFANALMFEPAEGRKAFLSNQPWTPTGGLAGADARCTQDAVAAGLTGTFKALLATSSSSAASRFSDGLPWVRLDGVLIVNTPSELFSGTAYLLAPLQLTADGVYRRNSGGWSGSAYISSTGTHTCNDWTSSLATDFGVSGRAQFGTLQEALGYDGEGPCNQFGVNLYCLQDS
jgi:cysteine-rich repeat protein